MHVGHACAHLGGGDGTGGRNVYTFEVDIEIMAIKFTSPTQSRYTATTRSVMYGGSMNDGRRSQDIFCAIAIVCTVQCA
jgi:hypothetical protein